MYRQRHCTCTCMYDGRQNAMYICMYVWWQAVAFRVQGLGRQIRLGFSSGFRVQGLGRQKALPFTRTWEAGTRREPQDEIVQMANSHTLTNRELVFAFSTNGKFPFTNDKSLHISKTTNSQQILTHFKNRKMVCLSSGLGLQQQKEPHWYPAAVPVWCVNFYSFWGGTHFCGHECILPLCIQIYIQTYAQIHIHICIMYVDN